MSKNLAAVVQKPKARIEVVERDIPKPSPDQVLVKNHVVAINPADWMLQEYDFLKMEYPVVLGSDVASEVVSVGSNVKLFKPGDRVLGFAPMIGTGRPDNGAFQTYTLLPSIATSTIPANITDEQAAVLPMQIATVGDAVFHHLGLPRFGGPPLKEGILIWGGMTSIGLGALQVCKLLGLTTYVTASARHHDFLQSLGADHLFDYKDAGAFDAIIEAAKKTGERVRYGFDAVTRGSPNSAVLSAKILAQLADGQPAKLAVALQWPEDEQKPSGVEVKWIQAFATTTSELGAWLFNDWLPKALADGSYKPLPEAEVMGSGLKDIQRALDHHKAGVSGKKVIVPLV